MSESETKPGPPVAWVIVGVLLFGCVVLFSMYAGQRERTEVAENVAESAKRAENDAEMRAHEQRDRLDAYRKKCGPIAQVWKVGEPEKTEEDKRLDRMERSIGKLAEDIEYGGSTE